MVYQDIREMDFPRTIEFEEARDLCSYLAVNLDDCHVRFQADIGENYGFSFGPSPKSVDELVVNRGTERIWIGVDRRKNTSKVGLKLKTDYQETGQDTYKPIHRGLDFEVFGRDLKHLPENDEVLIRDIREVITRYFTEKKQK